MLTYHESRRRDIGQGIYKVRSWYFLGILVYRRWEQLTTWGDLSCPSEVER